MRRLIDARTAGRAVLPLACLLSTAAAALDIANTPLFVPKPVAPNVVVTLDDSSSMAWAFVPDLCGSAWGDDPAQCHDANGNVWAILGSRRIKSAHFNPLYFNPAANYPPPLQVDGTPLAVNFNAAPSNGFDPSRGTLDLGAEYRPTAAYNPKNLHQVQSFAPHPAADFADVNAGVPAYYYEFDAGLANCTAVAADQKDDEDCYRKVDVPDAKKQQFANWYAFYRTRNLMTVTAASRAFAGLPDAVRVAWQSINTCFTPGAGFAMSTLASATCAGWDAAASVSNSIRPFTGNHRDHFYDWLFRLPAQGGTPLRTAMRRAGEYFALSGVDGPGDNEIGVADAGDADPSRHFACRPNFQVMMTDGLWNDVPFTVLQPVLGAGNYDNNNQALGDGGNYVPRAPYSDGNSNSLADLAFYYWSRDLRGDLPNKLIPYFATRSGNAVDDRWNPKNDPATWQHMVNYFVGLGLTGSLTAPGLDWAGDTYAGGYANLLTGAAWPASAAVNPGAGNVYDLWHAALNSRGQFFSADDPERLSKSFAAILENIQARSSTASATVANTARLEAGAIVYQAGFNSLDWSGALRAYALNEATGEIKAELWNAADLLPAHGARAIYTWDAGTSQGSEFKFASLNAAQLAAFTAGEQNARINYLRGDQSQEGTYRRRSSRLGDIVNSDPLFVAALDFGYEALAGVEGSSYRAFVNNNRNRTKMLYVGANDGMLHGFGANDGIERFAYVPNAAILAQDPDNSYRLNKLAQTDYAHRFFVDGSPFVGDAYLGNAWATVLLGGMGAGGKAVFALDITNPAAFDATKVMWEYTDAADLGHTFGQPIIVRLNNGAWGAVFGNGVNSTNQRAVLHVVNLETGALIRKLDTGVGNAANPNGLSTTVAYDSNNDRVTDVVYAGDLQGNVWKFNLANADPNNWSVAYQDAGNNPVPLFRARNGNNQAQPVTAPIELGRAPGGLAGVTLFFGTGRFFADGDNLAVNAQTQSFYAIHDNGSAIASTDRSELQVQVIEAQANNFGFDLRKTSDNAVDYVTKRGWYMDLPGVGERVVNVPLLRHGKVIFTTLIPSEDPCDFGGDSWLMEVNAESGDRPDESVFDFSGDKQFTAADHVNFAGDTVPVSGLKSPVGIIDTPAVLAEETSEIKTAFGTREGVNGEKNLRVREAGGLVRSGRVSWREIID